MEDFILTLLVKYTTFLFDLFLEAMEEILEKISLVFWEIWRHLKDISKLTHLYLNFTNLMGWKLKTELTLPRLRGKCEKLSEFAQK